MVKLTAEEWQLYTKTMDCKDAVESINFRLNELLEHGRKMIGSGKHHPVDIGRCVIGGMRVFLIDFTEYGAMDTEPRVVLAKTVEKELGLPENTLEP